MTKKVLVAGAAIAGLLVLTVLGLFLFLDANQFRPQLEQAMGGALGRKVAIGNIKLALFSGGIAVDDFSHCRRPGVQRRAVRDGQNRDSRRGSDAAHFFAEPSRRIGPPRGAAGRSPQFSVW